ncbi:MAG: L-lactate permease [Alphaproteobacteria bacterium]|nr:L-lactate permease [Alphaproteobacteria bacterium]
MPALLAASPILVACVLLLLLRQSALRAGFAGLAVALALARLGADSGSIPLGLRDGLLHALNVAYVLLGGVALSAALRAAGALEAIAAALARALPDPGRRDLVAVLGLSVFFESVTGFGIGIIVTAPLFLALGLPPARAGLLALLGQCAVPWGALAIGTTLGAQLFGVDEPRMGVLAAALNLPLILAAGLLTLALTGGPAALRRGWGFALLLAVTLAAGLALASRFIGIEVAGAVAALATTAVGLAGAAGGWRALATPALARMAAPLLLLLATLLATRLIAPLRQALAALLTLRLPEIGYTLAPFYHPGFWMLLAAALGLLQARAKGVALRPLAAPALRQWTIAALAVVGFLGMSQVMFRAGMTERLADAAVAAAGAALYAAVVPWIGGVGGFLTASNTGSNALFAQLQTAAADRLGLPLDWVAAAHNAAGANATMASPGRVVLAAAIVGLAGREALLLRPALALTVVGLAAMSAQLWLSLIL